MKYYLPLKEGPSLYLNKLEFPSPDNAMCQILQTHPSWKKTIELEHKIQNLISKQKGLQFNTDFRNADSVLKEVVLSNTPYNTSIFYLSAIAGRASIHVGSFPVTDRPSF